MSQDLKINITTTADTGGAKAAATALGEVAVASKKGGDAAKDQGKKVNEMGESFEKASAAGRMLGEVATGNIAAFGQFGAVIKAVGQAFKTNPLFLIGSIVAMTVLPVFKKLSEGWAAQKKATEEAGKAVEESMQKARDAIAKKADNELAKVYQEIEASAARALAQINAVTAAVIAQTDAEEAVALAQIDSNDQLSNEEKITAKLKVSTEARTKRTQSQIGALNGADEQAAKTAAGKQEAVGITTRTESTARSMLQQIGARSPEVIKKELQANAAEQEQVRQTASRQKGGYTQKDVDKIAELGQRRADLEQESADAATNYAPKLAAAQAALIAATEKRAKAEEDAAQAAAAAADTKSLNDIKRKTLGIQEAGANQVAQSQAAVALPSARAKDAAASAEAATLFNVRAGVGTFGTLAKQAGNAATPKVYGDKANPELFNAAKNLNDAAKAAEEGGTTPEEAKALVEAATALAAVMQAQKVESALMKAAIKTLTDQVATLRTR